MRKTGLIACLALLLAITGSRAGPLLNSTVVGDNAVDSLSNKTGLGVGTVICSNATDTPCSPGFHSILSVVQNGTANGTKADHFDNIEVTTIQNNTANVTEKVIGGHTALNWICGRNASLAGNHSGSAPSPQCAALLPTHDSTANCTNTTHCSDAGNNGKAGTQRNSTLRNDTTEEHMLNDDDPKINEAVDGNSSLCPALVSREAWGGRPPLSVHKVRAPVPFVVIHHTYQPAACNDSADCEAKMRSMQAFHMGKGWLNIGYNFIVGGDNRVYIGRGWDVVGAHSPNYNSKSVGISFIGDYRTELPTQEMMELAWSVIRCGVARGSISEAYKLVGHRQVRDTECPGERLYQEIQTWPHWVAHRDIVPRTNTTTTS